MLEIKDFVFVFQSHSPGEMKWHGRIHLHNVSEYELHYFLNGVGQFQVNETTLNIEPGMVVITPPGEVHRVVTDSVSEPLTYYAVLVNVSNSLPEIKKLFSELLKMNTPYLVGTKYRLFFEEVREKTSSVDESLFLSGVFQLLSLLYALGSGVSRTIVKSEIDQVIEKILTIMQENIQNKLELTHLSDAVGLSKEYLVRIFKSKMGVAPMKYFTALKVQASKYYLISSDAPTYVIADSFSFSSEFHFSKVFKHYAGLSPSGFRKEQFEQFSKNTH